MHGNWQIRILKSVDTLKNRKVIEDLESLTGNVKTAIKLEFEKNRKGKEN